MAMTIAGLEINDGISLAILVVPALGWAAWVTVGIVQFHAHMDNIPVLTRRLDEALKSIDKRLERIETWVDQKG